MKTKRINILSENVCELPNCNCGWNLTVGGVEKRDLEKIKDFIEHRLCSCKEKDACNLCGHITPKQ